MAICPIKKFTPELIRIYEGKMLKKIVYGTVEEIRLLENSPELPACVTLLIKVLLYDVEAGRMGTLNSILDSIS
jgi:hypothetical protein